MESYGGCLVVLLMSLFLTQSHVLGLMAGDVVLRMQSFVMWAETDNVTESGN